jgi:hypothetical protein
MRKHLYVILIAVLACSFKGLNGQANAVVNRLNKYQQVVIKDDNSVKEHKDAIRTKIREVLKACNLPEPSDPSVLYSSSVDQSKIITLVYSVTNLSSTSGEISVSVKFRDYNYETILSNTVKDKYQILNEKNYLKTVSKSLSILDGYTYKYEAPAPVVSNNPANPKKRGEGEEMQELHAVDVNFSDAGKYYALIIGVSDYTDPSIPDLDSLPVKDAIKLANVLSAYYTFDKENVTLLKNPSRRDIVIALDELGKKAGSTDNVLIFYAGHGHYEDDNGIGYWLPKDAEVNNSSNWLYNDQLVASIKKIKSLHTLLISDACFSGSIFKTRAVNMSSATDFVKKKYQLPSRKAITSGTLKTVPNVSVFIKYLLQNLSNNKEQFLTSSQLFQSLEAPVGNNAPSVPQYGVIQNVGDEGGDFIFIKRESAAEKK